VYSVQLAVILENFQLALTRSWRRGVGKLLPTTIVMIWKTDVSGTPLQASVQPQPMGKSTDAQMILEVLALETIASIK
jgi:hypothetical protein